MEGMPKKENVEQPRQPQAHDSAPSFEEKVLDELEKLKIFIHGNFERQNGFITTLTRLVPPRHSDETPLNGAKHVIPEAPSKGPLGLCMSPEMEKVLNMGTNASEDQRSSVRSSPVEKQESLNSTDTFVHAYLKNFQQKAKAAGDHLKQKRRLSMLTQVEDSDTWRGLARRITNSPFFAYVVTTIITFNLIILGIEVDVSVGLGQQDIPRWFSLCNSVVVILFVFELAITLFAQGCYTFFFGKERWWNLFDLLIIVLSLLEAVIDFWVEVTSSPSQLRFVRTVRLARALRGIRVMRLLRYVTALRTLVLSIMSSMASLLWTLVLLMLLFYSFGVLFTQMVVDECRYLTVTRTSDLNAVPSCGPDFMKYWDSIPKSMLTLFMSITGGLDWEFALEPLTDTSPLAVAALIVYVTITFFAIVNVITGVFVTTAMETTSADKDLTVMKQIQTQNAQVDDLKHMFAEICGAGPYAEVSLDEFQRAMSSPKFSAFLQSMGISTEDVGVLFLLLDADSSGLVELDEFVTGCLNLHGSAKSSQLARMSYENKLTRREIKHMQERMMDIHAMMRMVYENWSV